MSTVVSRTFASTPNRDASATWTAIVDMLTRRKDGAARQELLRVGGIAASTIADRAPTNHPIVVTCSGPRTRVYCIYDDDAVEGSHVNEEPLGFDPLNGDWHVSLPCCAEDLGWVQGALKARSTRITARGPDEDVRKTLPATAARPNSLVFDPKGFLRS
jgi:hypothetical protein